MMRKSISAICVLLMVTTGYLAFVPVSANTIDTTIPDSSSASIQPMTTGTCDSSTTWHINRNSYSFSIIDNNQNVNESPYTGTRDYGMYIMDLKWNGHYLMTSGFQSGIRWKYNNVWQQVSVANADSCSYTDSWDGSVYQHSNLYRWTTGDGSNAYIYYKPSINVTSCYIAFDNKIYFASNNNPPINNIQDFNVWWKMEWNIGNTNYEGTAWDWQGTWTTLTKPATGITENCQGVEWEGDKFYNINYPSTRYVEDWYEISSLGAVHKWAGFQTPLPYSYFKFEENKNNNDIGNYPQGAEYLNMTSPDWHLNYYTETDWKPYWS